MDLEYQDPDLYSYLLWNGTGVALTISVMSRDPQSLWITHIHAIAYW